MENIFVTAGVISVIFFIAKFIEMRFFDKEEKKALKLVVRDSLLVYISVVCGYFILEQFTNATQTGKNIGNSTPIFTDNPEF